MQISHRLSNLPVDTDCCTHPEINIFKSEISKHFNSIHTVKWRHSYLQFLPFISQGRNSNPEWTIKTEYFTRPLREESISNCSHGSAGGQILRKNFRLVSIICFPCSTSFSVFFSVYKCGARRSYPIRSGFPFLTPRRKAATETPLGALLTIVCRVLSVAMPMKSRRFSCRSFDRDWTSDQKDLISFRLFKSNWWMMTSPCQRPLSGQKVYKLIHILPFYFYISSNHLYQHHNSINECLLNPICVQLLLFIMFNPFYSIHYKSLTVSMLYQ